MRELVLVAWPTPSNTRSNCWIASMDSGVGLNSWGLKASVVAEIGTQRSTAGRSHTPQQRPRYDLLVIPISGSVRPHSGWRGSMTVTVGSGATLLPIGVVSWLGFPDAGRPQ